MKHKRITEFAASIGVSHTAVRKAIDTGRIPADLIGTKKLPGGRVVTVIVNPLKARMAYSGGDDASEESGTRAPSSLSVDVDDESPPLISKSRAITEQYKAKLARLEYEERRGKLVDANNFRTKYSAMIVTARTRLLGVPSKAKGRIPHLSIEDIGILTTLIREALQEAADGWPQFDHWFESMREHWLPFVDSAPSTDTASNKTGSQR